MSDQTQVSTEDSIDKSTYLATKTTTKTGGKVYEFGGWQYVILHNADDGDDSVDATDDEMDDEDDSHNGEDDLEKQSGGISQDTSPVESEEVNFSYHFMENICGLLWYPRTEYQEQESCVVFCALAVMNIEFLFFALLLYYSPHPPLEEDKEYQEPRDLFVYVTIGTAAVLPAVSLLLWLVVRWVILWVIRWVARRMPCCRLVQKIPLVKASKAYNDSTDAVSLCVVSAVPVLLFVAFVMQLMYQYRKYGRCED